MNEKAVIILGAGLMQKPAICAAKELGFKTVVADGNPDAVCSKMADIFEPVDLKDKDGLVQLAEKTKENALDVFTKCIENVRPLVEVKARRVGGANYQVPTEVKPLRSTSLAMRWLIGAAQSRKGRPMAEKLAEEIILGSKKEGTAFKKREDVHKMAEANRAFAHFKW